MILVEHASHAHGWLPWSSPDLELRLQATEFGVQGLGFRGLNADMRLLRICKVTTMIGVAVHGAADECTALTDIPSASAFGVSVWGPSGFTVLAQQHLKFWNVCNPGHVTASLYLIPCIPKLL